MAATAPFELTLSIPAEYAKFLLCYCDTEKGLDWYTMFTLHFCQDEGGTKFCADVIIGKEIGAKDLSCLSYQLMAAPCDDTAPALVGDTPPEISDTKKVDVDASCLDLQSIAAPRDGPAPAPTVSVYIALAGDTPEILDYEYFHTHGYIPAWGSIRDAVEALQYHLYGTTNVEQYTYTVYKFGIVDNRLFYMRPDKFHAALQKLFFPLPLHNDAPEDSIQNVWLTKYRRRCRYPAKWV